MSKRAGVYVRISLDRDGEGLGVARQEQDCRTRAEALGWSVVEVFTDNDVSATKNIVRPAYTRMLAALVEGRIDAVIVYDLDRLTRKPAELEAFIEFAEQQGTALANVSGDVDLTTASGRMVARIKGAVARQEADRISERVTRQKRQRAEQGLPFGGSHRTFGYTRDFEVHPEEQRILEEAFTRVAAGESIQSVVNDFNKREILTSTGSLWRRTTLRKILDRHAYAGVVFYKGEEVAKTSYPALIPEGLFRAVQERLGASMGAGKNARAYLLSGIVVCGLCFTPMYGNRSSAGRYLCRKEVNGCGRVTINLEWVDYAIVSEVAAVGALKVSQRFEDGEITPRDFTGEIAGLDSEIETIRSLHKAGELDLMDMVAILKGLRTQRAALVLESAKEDMTFPTAVIDEARVWKHGSVSEQRVALQKYISAIVVKPTTKMGRQKFDPARLEIHWKDGRKTQPVAYAFRRQVEALAKTIS